MLHLFSGDTVARRQAPTWRFPWKFVLTVLALTLVATFVAGAIVVVANLFSSSAPAQQPVQAEVNVPAVIPAVPAMVDVPNPLVQSTEPETVAPVVPTLFTPRWEEMGKVYNGDQVLALPIEWDRMVNVFYEQSDGKELGIALPPTTSAKTNAIPLSRLGGYVPIGNGQVILYAYSDYRWSVEDPQGVTYWKAVVPASVVERLNP